MIDFNVEVSFSGIGLLPAEAIRLGFNSGLKALGLILRVDQCSYCYELPRLLNVVEKASLYGGIDVVAGVKFVHVPSALLSEVIPHSRELGAQLVLVHGEGENVTMLQSVEVGTNFAAINAGVDILSCPGLLSLEDAALAAEKNVAMELTVSYPNSLYNGHIVQLARKYSCPLTISCGLSNRRSFCFPEVTKNLWEAIGLGSGLKKKELNDIQIQSRTRMQNIFMRKTKSV